MKNNFKIVWAFLGSALLYASCRPEIFELGALANKNDLQYTIAPSSTNPNDIVLTSLTPNVTPMWVTPYGQSIRIKDTVNVPFPGTYKFVYGVESAGGFVQADTATVVITGLDKNAVSTPAWTALTGGYGKSKTWVLDITPTGTSKLFNGPIYFGGTGWEWDAGWASWICPLGDYGSMTFDLKGDANFSSNNKMVPAKGASTGKFMLYTGTMELATFGAQLLQDPNQGPNVQNWSAKMAIKSLTPDGLEVICITGAGSWVIYNYVSQDYYDTH